MVEPNEAWPLIKTAAIKAMDAKMIWHSLKQKKQYRVHGVGNDRIVIYRIHKGTTQDLTADKIFAAAQKLNQSGGTIRRRTLISPTVAEETAFVLFHPQLTWSEDHKYILDTNFQL